MDNINQAETSTSIKNSNAPLHLIITGVLELLVFSFFYFFVYSQFQSLYNGLGLQQPTLFQDVLITILVLTAFIHIGLGAYHYVKKSRRIQSVNKQRVDTILYLGVSLFVVTLVVFTLSSVSSIYSILNGF